MYSWRQPLYSNIENSLNPEYIYQLSTTVNVLFYVVLILQLGYLSLAKESQPGRRKRIYVIKLGLIYLVSFLSAILYFRTEELSLLLFAIFSMLGVLPLHILEYRCSDTPAVSLLLFWIANFAIWLVSTIQDMFSSHKIYGMEYGYCIIEMMITISCLVILILEGMYYEASDGVLQYNKNNMKPEGKSIFSTLTFSWLLELIDQVRKYDEIQNLPKTPSLITCEISEARLRNNWKRELSKCVPTIDGPKKRTRSPSLLKTLLKSFCFPTSIFVILDLIDGVLNFAQPFILKLLIEFFQSRKEGQFPSSKPAIIGYFLAGLLFLNSCARFLISNQANLFQSKLVFLVDSSLTSMVYMKAITLSPESRKNKTIGDIVNHITIDINTLKWSFEGILDLFSIPMSLIFSIISLHKIIHNATWGGILAALILIPGTSILSSLIMKHYLELMKFRDARTSLTNEILSTIRSVKFYSWETAMASRISELRNDQELVTRRKIGITSALSVFLWSCIPFFISCASYTTFTLIYDIPLTPAIVFPSLTLFTILTQSLTRAPYIVVILVQAIASLKRLSEFLNLEEVAPKNTYDSAKGAIINLKHISFKWSNKGVINDEAEIENTNNNIALENINIEASNGTLICIVGRVGSGKTTLLRAILGELPPIESRDSTFDVNGTIAYCTQNPWILNGTVRDNITFGQEYDREFYWKTIEACALVEDLRQLPYADKTVVGEKGISLSGGQKARISLARAVYSNADIYILDDILSAVDAHVGKHLIDQVLGKSGILETKIKILSTNSVNVLKEADEIIYLKNQTIKERGDFSTVEQNNSDLAKLIEEFGNNKEDTRNEDYVENSLLNKTNPQQITSTDNKTIMESNKIRKESISAIEVNPETTMKGVLKFDTLMKYLRACNYKFVIFYLILTCGTFLTTVGGKYLLTYWSERNEILGKTDNPILYLSIYATFGILGCVFSLIGAFIIWTFCIILGARFFHDTMLQSVLRSPMSFFETTPVGRILNRFTDDVEVIDSNLPWVLIMMLNLFLEGVITFSVIVTGLHMMVIVLVLLIVLYNYYRKMYIPTSKELKRLESISKSPVLANIQESINGVDTIRAYNQQERFISNSKKNINKLVSVGFTNQLCYRWLSVRLQFISSAIVFSTSVISIMSLNQEHPINPALFGFVMNYAFNITSILDQAVRVWADVENYSVSLERVIEYCELPSEAALIVDSYRPSVSWPDRGEIQFKDYSTSYKSNLDPVLKRINFTVDSGQKIGIVGRTGAGKSSLTLAIFRIIEPTTGQIVIDGMDTSKLGLSDLRSKLNIIPQESHIIEGSIRQNIDPLGQYKDEEIWRVLELTHLKDHVLQMQNGCENNKEVSCGGLDSKVSEDGSNLSSGQKQLICLARALLKKDSKILIMDEATASIDVQTDKLIQETIKREFKDKTVLTIAHRLETVMESDKILVLEEGKIIEFDSPQTLLEDKSSAFYSLCSNSKKFN